jgi:uncharacterized membrane protein (DUF485 family)
MTTGSTSDADSAPNEGQCMSENHDATPTATAAGEVWERTQESGEFKELRSRFRRFSFPMAVIFLVWYFIFVLLMIFAREWVSTPVLGNLNIAFVLAILQFVSTFAIVIAYDVYSNRRLDDMREDLRQQVETELHHDRG